VLLGPECTPELACHLLLVLLILPQRSDRKRQMRSNLLQAQMRQKLRVLQALVYQDGLQAGMTTFSITSSSMVCLCKRESL